MRETLLNIRGHLLLSAVTLVFCAVMGGSAVWAAMSEASSIRASHANLVHRGATLLSVTATDGQPISAGRCDALNSVTGVASAGGIIASRPVSSPLASLRTLPGQLVTPGFPKLVWPELGEIGGGPSPGVVVGPTLAEELGLRSGALIGGDAESSPATVPPRTSARFVNADSQILIPVPAHGTLRECVIEPASGAMAAVETLLTQWFPEDPEIFVSRVKRDLGPDDGGAAMASRLSRFAGAVGGSLVAVMLALSWVIRRPDFGLYTLVDRSRRSRFLLVCADTSALALIPFALGASITVVTFSPVVPAFALEAGRTQLLIGLCLIVTTPVAGYLLTSAGGPVKILKQG